MDSNEDINSSETMSTSKRKVGRSSKKDSAWDHARCVQNKPRNMVCKYCNKEFTGGAYRFKHHLACTHKDVEPCSQVPDEVKDKFREILMIMSEATHKRKNEDFSFGMGSCDDKGNVGKELKKSKGSLTSFFNENTSNEVSNKSKSTMHTWSKKEIRDEAAMAICWFLYENAIPFNVVRSPSYLRMCESIAKHGPGFNPATYHEVQELNLEKAVISTNSFVDEHRAEWGKLGCTIMSDGWTDTRKRSVLNFMVNSPKGTVFMQSIDSSDVVKSAQTIFNMLDKFVEHVGEENVMQVVTDNASNFIKAGELLMVKRKHLFWMPCQMHSVELILEDFEKKLPLHKETITKGRKITTFIYSRTVIISMLKYFTKGKDLIRPAMTRFATSYLTIGCLFALKSNLIAMFASEIWKKSRFANKPIGKEVEGIILDKRFWANVKICIKAAFPLIKVLRLVCSDVQSAMPFIHEAIQNAQEAIKKNFNNANKSYEPIFNIINERWLDKMNKPLHIVAYYLNPRVFYKDDFEESYWLKKAWYEVCERMISDVQLIAKMDRQMLEFSSKRGLFGVPSAMVNLHNMSPADWWKAYGDNVPELQRFAVRILSLACRSSSCERNWGAHEKVQTKNRNCLSQKKMDNLSYVMYNIKLANKKPKGLDSYDIDDIASDDEWIVDANGEDLDVDSEDDVINMEATQSREHLEDMVFHDIDGNEDTINQYFH